MGRRVCHPWFVLNHDLEKMLSFAKGLLARKKSDMVANIASRAAQAVLSNPDLLDCVFEFLGFHNADYLSLEYAVDIHALRLCHKNDPLRRMALVCKTWHSSTVILLYRDIQVYQKESIPLLLRTLKKSGTLRQVVRSFAYIPPKSPMLKWVGQPVKELHNQVCEICALLPNVAPLRLKLIEPASAPLLKSSSNNIRLLHIIPVGGVFSPEGVMSLSFPILETLTLEFAGRQLSGIDTEFRLDAPNLTRLRLIGSYLNTRSSGIPSWLLDILPKIKHLELIHMFASEGDGAVYKILEHCADTLESIVLNPRSTDINYEGMHDFTEFRSLKHVTLRIPPVRLGLPPSKLPVNLNFDTLYHGVFMEAIGCSLVD
ncbi:hypothetical protein SCHPADRAFT_890515 [Schizopora paradoxa]|uniref:Uncharacterized protein n=1 Tax=Schizopora paradoxa TaxID=27342 RepID=A0A0H2RLJ6_9AGAM|nr:hypothetical protein SCHPADRAFT_890515 [Schizopora paradoxa]